MVFCFLTPDFYNEYSDCPEIETKHNRPYVQVCIRINGLLFVVPMRSHIRHEHVLWTDKENVCGLDFSKAVVILDEEKYIDHIHKPQIRQNEFNSLKVKEHIIYKKMTAYIKRYKKAKENQHIIQNKQLCEYSTLQYFEKYL